MFDHNHTETKNIYKQVHQGLTCALNSHDTNQDRASSWLRAWQETQITAGQVEFFEVFVDNLFFSDFQLQTCAETKVQNDL